MKLDEGFNFDNAIGKCEKGYIFETSSETCLFLTAYHERNQNCFFLKGAVLPELSIENINNAFLEPTGDNDWQESVDEQTAKKLIELYNNFEIHEIKQKDSIVKIKELNMECEQFRGLFFGTYIYTDGFDYYMQISRQYDSHANCISIICSKCTSEIKKILEQN